MRPRLSRNPTRALAAALLILLGSACQPGGQAQPTAAPTSPAAPAPTGASSPAAAAPPVSPSPAAAASPSPAAAARPASAPTAELTTAIRQVAQRVKPAVVQITNQQQVQPEQFNQPFTVPAGVGSGVIYDAQGHILTNNHVIEGAQSLLISLPDGRSFPGKLVGADPQTDLAVVQISGDSLPVAELGDSHELQVGDWVVAIGNALALPGGPTVTEGVVSALDRTVQEPGGQGPGGPGPGGARPGAQASTAGPFLFDVIQTDAPINPGNSGGPLVNLQSQVVGISTLVAGQAEPGVAAQGIGFAIAISTAKPIADQLVASGHVAHAFIGIRYVPLNPAVASQLGTTAKNGAAVADVVSNSPAAQAGLRARDVITAIDGQPLQTESSLAQAISAHKPGDTVTLTVQRGSQQLSLQVKLAEMPPS